MTQTRNPKITQQAKERDEYTCQKCGMQDTSRVEGHHIHPLHRGGEDAVDNIATLCASCHEYAPTRVESPDIEHLFEVYTSTGYVPEADFVLFGSEITGRLRKNNNGDGSSIFYPDELVNIVLDTLKYRGKMADNLRKDKWWLLFARLAEHEGVQPLSIESDVSDMSEDEAWGLLEEMYRE